MHYTGTQFIALKISLTIVFLHTFAIPDSVCVCVLILISTLLPSHTLVG